MVLQLAGDLADVGLRLGELEVPAHPLDVFRAVTRCDASGIGTFVWLRGVPTRLVFWSA